MTGAMVIADPTELYRRQRNIVGGIGTATVVGIGGTGTWVAILLAMMGTQTLNLMDDDKLELSNLARLPFKFEDEGRLKTEVAKEFIVALRPDTHVELFGKADEVSLQLVYSNVLFDCTDRASTQVRLYDHCSKHDIRYIRVGYDGFHMTVTSKPSGWSTEEEEEVGYSEDSSWIVPAIMAAALGVAKSSVSPGIEVNNDIVNIHKQLQRPPEPKADKPKKSTKPEELIEMTTPWVDSGVATGRMTYRAATTEEVPF